MAAKMRRQEILETESDTEFWFCRSNIAITISYISVLFHLDTSKIYGVMAV